ncbi:MAG TPA: hypothetical protein VF629_07840 [Hymenobacter sp.]
MAKYQEWHDAGSQLFNKQRNQLRQNLDDLVLGNGSLDGAGLQQQWFPQVEADVFISHSHADKETAIILAGLLHEEFDVKCFTDTTVWGYGDELLRRLDEKHCVTGPQKFSYEARNRSTSHVHLMLAGALSKMIDNTECVFFLNSPASVSAQQVMDTTLSPWLYFELLATQLLRKKTPQEHPRRQILTKSFSDDERIITESFEMSHPIELGHLTSLLFNNTFLNSWRDLAKPYAFKLDALYTLSPQRNIIFS